MIVYKFQPSIKRAELIKIKGKQGSYLNPFYDANKKLCISKEEFESNEFDFTGYTLTPIEFNPVEFFNPITERIEIEDKVKKGDYTHEKGEQEKEKVRTKHRQWLDKVYKD